MTAEHLATQPAPQALQPSTALELYRPPERLFAGSQVGRSCLEGFVVLEATISPWDDVREDMEARVVSQPAAIAAVIEALEGSMARLSNDKRPLANLAFLGPTGVGKSETAKSLAEIVGGDGRLIKIDCADYSQGHQVANLIGSPLGYVGHDIAPVFSKKNIEGYGTVVLFDEIEKGSTELYNLMLHIMEDGEIELKDGAKTSFRDATIIMTSNLGAKEMAAQLSSAPLGFASKTKQATTEELETVATKTFREFFAPEFINRLTKMVVFQPLDRDSLGQVLDSKLARANNAYEKQFGARINLSEGVREYLIDIASQELHMGARPLVRALDTHIYSTFGRYWGAGAIEEGTEIKVFHSTELGAAAINADSELIFAAKPNPSIQKEVIVSTSMVPAFEAPSRQSEATPEEDPASDDEPEQEPEPEE